MRKHHKRHEKSEAIQAAQLPLEYLKRASVARFNLQKYLLHFEIPSSKSSFVDLSIVNVASSTTTMVLVYFKIDGVPMEMRRSVQAEEIFVQGDDKPALIVAMKKPTIEKVELPPEEVALEDLSKGNLPIVGGSPMVIDEVQRHDHGVKRPKEAQDEDGQPMVFKRMKRTHVEGVLETFEDKEDLEKEIPECVQHKEWEMEGPSDPYAEVWEEVWDKDL